MSLGEERVLDLYTLWAGCIYPPEGGTTWGWMVLFSQRPSLGRADNRCPSEQLGEEERRNKSLGPEEETGWHITVPATVLDT